MAEKKKKQRAEFAEDKNAFAGRSSTKEDTGAKREKQKQPGAHQPRDADTTSGHHVQKSGQAKPSEHDADYSAKQNSSKPKGRPDSADVWDSHSSFQSNAQKTAGEKAKSSQKKRRQQKQFQRENSFTGKKEKPDGGNADGKAESSFSKEQNAFTEQNAFMEEDGGEQAGDTKEFKDDYRRRDTYHQSEKRADTAGGNIRTGNARKKVIPGVASRRRITPLRKAIPLPMAQNRNPRAAKS